MIMIMITDHSYSDSDSDGFLQAGVGGAGVMDTKTKGHKLNAIELNPSRNRNYFSSSTWKCLIILGKKVNYYGIERSDPYYDRSDAFVCEGLRLAILLIQNRFTYPNINSSPGIRE
jgi:hypothetical protein